MKANDPSDPHRPKGLVAVKEWQAATACRMRTEPNLCTFEKPSKELVVQAYRTLPFRNTLLRVRGVNNCRVFFNNALSLNSDKTYLGLPVANSYGRTRENNE